MILIGVDEEYGYDRVVVEWYGTLEGLIDGWKPGRCPS